MIQHDSNNRRGRTHVLLLIPLFLLVLSAFLPGFILNNQDAQAQQTPSITVTPDHGPAGTQVTVTGSGFLTSGTTPIVHLRLDSSHIYGQIDIDKDGNFQFAFNIPQDTVRGQHTVKAFNSDGVPATAQFTVDSSNNVGSDSGGSTITGSNTQQSGSPSLTLTPNQGPPGTVVTVTGKNLYSNEKLSIRVDNHYTTDVNTDGNGNFDPVQITIPADAKEGDHSIEVDNNLSAAIASATFTVKGEIQNKPVLHVSPDHGAPGTIVTLTGENYEQITTINTHSGWMAYILFDDKGDTNPALQAHVDEQGILDPTKFSIPQDATPGSHLITVQLAGRTDQKDIAQATFTVSGNSPVQPDKPQSNSQKETQSKTSESNTWETYTNADSDFSIQYPSGWIVQENPEPKVKVQISPPEGGSFINVFVSHQHYASFEDFVTDAKRSSSDIVSSSAIEQGITKMDDKDGYYFKYESDNKVVITALVPVGDDIYQITSANPEKSFTTYSDQFVHMMSSFKFLNSSSQSSENVSSFVASPTPPVVKDFVGKSIKINNLSTGDPVTQYVTVQSVPDKYAEQVLGIKGQYVTTIAFEDRYGRPDSNGNLNAFLQISHTGDKVNSVRGLELGGDKMSVSTADNPIQQSVFPTSSEIDLSQAASSTTQKVQDTTMKLTQGDLPQVVSDFLNQKIDLYNSVTNEKLTHYIHIQTVPDKYAEQVLGIKGQYVTTIAFEDRYGRPDSNGNLNAFLQISHTGDKVNSARLIQLGGDSISVPNNGGDSNVGQSVVKTVEIPLGGTTHSNNDVHTTTSTTDVNGLISYTAKDNSFSIKYPQGWKVEENPADIPAIVSFNDEYESTFIAIDKKPFPHQLSLKEFTESTFSTLQQLAPGSTLLDEGSITINGRDAYYMEYNLATTSGPLTTRVVNVGDGDNVYLIEGTISNPSNLDQIKQFDNIASTFELNTSNFDKVASTLNLPTSDNGFTSYVAKDNSFSIKYPQDWKVDDGQQNFPDDIVVLSHPQHREIFFIQIQKNVLQQSSLQEVVKSALDSQKNNLKNMKILNQGNMIINGKDAYFFDLTFDRDSDGKNVRTKSIIIPMSNGNDIYMLRSNIINNDNYQRQFDNIASTFEINTSDNVAGGSGTLHVYLKGSSNVTPGSFESLSIMVTDGTNPVSNAVVHIHPVSHAGHSIDDADVTTGPSGDYGFMWKIKEDSTPGTYEVDVSVTKDGYNSVTQQFSFEVS